MFKFKKFKLSESEGVLGSLILIWTAHVLSFGLHSFAFLLSFFIYIFVFKLKSYRSIVLLCLSSAMYFFGNFSSNYLIKKGGFSNYLWEFQNFLRPKLSQVISNNYSSYSNDTDSEECAQFISFLLFNQKKGLNRETSLFLKELANLSVSHLLVVSGMHLNILKTGINGVVKIVPFKVVRKILILLSLFGYVWATTFSLPSSRVLFEELASVNNSEERAKERFSSDEKKNVSSLVKWSRATGLSFLFFPNSLSSASFLLSYFFSFSFRLIDRGGDRVDGTKLQKTLFKIAFASIFSTLIFSHKTKKLFVLAALNQLFLSPVIIPLFIFYFLSGPFSFLSGLGFKIYSWFTFLISSLSLNKSYIPREGGSYLEVLYSCFGLSLVVLFFSFWAVRTFKVEEES